MLRPLRYPIISRDLIFATRNSKLAFHLRELQFASLYPLPLSLSSSYFTLFTFLFIFPPTLFGPSVTFQSDLPFLPFPIISVVLRFYTPPQPSRHFSFTCQPTPSLLLHKNQIHWKRGGKIVRYSFKINLFRGVQFSIGTRISTRD